MANIQYLCDRSPWPRLGYQVIEWGFRLPPYSADESYNGDSATESLDIWVRNPREDDEGLSHDGIFRTDGTQIVDGPDSDQYEFWSDDVKEFIHNDFLGPY